VLLRVSSGENLPTVIQGGTNQKPVTSVLGLEGLSRLVRVNRMSTVAHVAQNLKDG